MADELVRWWSALTTEEVARLAKRDPVAVLALGSTEQHGPHLPLSTDLDIALGLLATAFRTIGDVPAVAMPPQAVGSSREHARFPGTLSLEPDLLANLIEEIGAALAACGIRRLVLANAHGGNRHALDAAGLRLRDEHDMLVVKASWFRFPRPEGVDLPESEWRHGLHGGAVETAMMLHLRPDLVRRERAAAARSLGEELEGRLGRLGPEGDASFSWLAGDLHASGVVGDARRADPDMGARLVEHYGAVLAQVIRDARSFPLDRLG